MSSEKRNFDDVAATWDEKPARVKLAGSIALAMLDLVDPSPDMDLLDFGCGTGLIAYHFQSLVRSITGVDSSHGMIDVFNAKAEASGIDNAEGIFVDFDQGDTLTGHYDIIVSAMAFHHIRDISDLLNKFCNILAPGGTLCVADLDLEEGHFHDDDTGIFYFGFDRSELRQLFTDAGFTDIQIRDVTKMDKEGADGVTRTFSIFAISGRL